MRTIKFRAWDVRQGVMIEDAINATETQSLLTTTLDLSNQFAHFDGLRWMQFIGLKDKKGKEVYESDYITFTEGDDIWVFKVIYVESKACFALESPNRFMDIMAANFSAKLTELYCDKFEVIGDEYRNPQISEILGSLHKSKEEHTCKYPKSIHEPRPRKCVICGKLETI